MQLSDFDDIISTHCIRLYRLCLFTIESKNRETILNRRFLGRFNLEATWMEETLDAAGARHSEKWFPFREGVSAIKLFSSVCYDVLHVKKSFPYYDLINSESHFNDDVSGVLEDIYLALVKASNYLVKKAKKCGMHSHDLETFPEDFIDLNVGSILEKDRKLRHIENPGTTLIYLSTEFLSLKGNMHILSDLKSIKKHNYKECIPDIISEEKLRLVLVRFHNLQSLYDTYLSESDIESADDRLKVLRGHISFIYHMLKSVTEFSHYYERHIVPRQSSLFFKSLLPMNIERFLEITIDFFMKNFILYFNGATELCHDVIDSYAEIGEKDISIPEYRGFHVRPSSLIAKIVNYYGGRVKLIISGEEYDPSTPLELFRVNEAINAIKRVKLFELAHNEALVEEDIKSLLHLLEERGDVVVYDGNLDDLKPRNEETIEEYLKKTFAFLLASGKIDIKMYITVKFIGDLRSLDDIELLAQHGYGEDKYGKNITLPKKLSYLKR